MGNKCSCDLSACCPWFYKKPLNLPPKTKVVDRPKPEVPVDTDNVEFFAIKGWNWELSRNGEEHHTSSYVHMNVPKASPPPPPPSSEEEEEEAGEKEINSSLIIRRGQKFYLTIQTNIPYDSEKHKISLMFFLTDCNTNFGNGSEVGVRVGTEDVNGWWANVHSQTGSSLTLEIKCSASAIVGQWRLEVDTDSEGKTHSFSPSQRFFVLFNPWCKEDSVYLEGEEERKEFVLSDSGLIWRGTHSRLRPCPWQFGQYEKNILECVFYVLNNSCHLLPVHRRDPIKVVRAISAGVNSPDDSGVLQGNWTGEYEGGRAPSNWRGSIDILQQYFDKKKSVKYGQCWVFSGVVTTACRTLGIPCRSVTNFSSAHDTHNSLTIDYFFGDEGEKIEELNADSVWNFHVWNEVWMTRPDLGDDYAGWQVIDATPQEESDGQFRCGPSSLVAIKRGEIYLPYDNPFVYAEVNADTLFWKYQGKRQPMKLLGRKTGGVGINISTKAIGKMRRDDITYLYKHKEDTEEERRVMFEALRRCQNAFARYYLNQKFEDVEFQLHLKDDIIIGKPFRVSVSITNKSDNEHDVTVVLRADTMLYMGTLKENVKKYESHITMKPHSEQTVEMQVSLDEYYKKLVDQCAFNISCLGKVKDTDFEYFAQDDFRVRKPDIKIKCLSDNVRVGNVSKWTASFDNPLPMKLNKGRLYVLPSNADSTFIKLKKKVDEHGVASIDFDVTPKKAGEMTVSVIFSSKELEDVDGFVTQNVSERAEETKPTVNETSVPDEEKEENGKEAEEKLDKVDPEVADKEES